MNKLIYKNRIVIQEDVEGTIDILNFLHPYFNFVKGKSVLEVGPGEGLISELILSHDPLDLTLIEPNDKCFNDLIRTFTDVDNINIVKDDIFSYINNNVKKYDVVILLGVIYHLHSTLQLLEVVKNFINPEYVCLDNISFSHIQITKENTNLIGQRQANKGWYYIDYSILLPKDIIRSAMSDLAYKLIETNEYIESYQWKKDFYFDLYKKT